MRRSLEYIATRPDRLLWGEWIPPTTGKNRNRKRPTRIERPVVYLDSIWETGGGRGSVKPKRTVAVRCASEDCVHFGSVHPSGLCHKCHLQTLPPSAFKEVQKCG